MVHRRFVKRAFPEPRPSPVWRERFLTDDEIGVPNLCEHKLGEI